MKFLFSCIDNLKRKRKLKGKEYKKKNTMQESTINENKKGKKRIQTN